MPEALLWTPRAWIVGRWQESVLLEVDRQGHWVRISPGLAVPPTGTRVLPGPVLPGMVRGQIEFAGAAGNDRATANAHQPFVVAQMLPRFTRQGVHSRDRALNL